MSNDIDETSGAHQQEPDYELELLTEDESMPAVVESAFETDTTVTIRLASASGRFELWSGRGDAEHLAYWDDRDGWVAEDSRQPRRGVLDDYTEPTPVNIAYWLLSLGWQIEASGSMSRRRVIARPRSVRTGDLANRSWKYFGLAPGSALRFEWVRSSDGREWSASAAGRLGAERESPFDPGDAFALGLELAPDWLMPEKANGPPMRHSDGGAVAESELPASAFLPVPEPDSAELARRRTAVRRWLIEAEFHGPFGDRDAVRNHFCADPAISSGHYALVFRDGQAYIGETVDFNARFGQHSITYSDIESFYVRPDGKVASPVGEGRNAAKRMLRQVERGLIHSAQNDGLILRNTMEMSNPIKVATSFSEVATDDDIARWVRRPDAANVADSSVPKPVARQHAAARERAFNRFIDLPEAEQVLRIVGAYIQRCIPFPARTEYASWAISCLPTALRGATGSKERWSVVCCLSIARPETLTITRHKQTGVVAGFVAVNEVELGFDHEVGQLRFLRQHPGVLTNSEAHASFGPGVLLLHAPDLDALEHLLDDTRVTRAASTVALRMCRVGPSTQRSAHNPYLVDAALGWERDQTS